MGTRRCFDEPGLMKVTQNTDGQTVPESPVVVFGLLPPPYDGQTIAALEVSRILGERHDLTVLQVERPPNSSMFRRALLTMSQTMRLWKLIRGRSATVYITASSGSGKILDIMPLAVCRWSGAHSIYHHQVFSYSNEYSRAADLAMRIAGPSVTHLVLCDCMSDRLSMLYKVPQRASFVAVSNRIATGPPIDLVGPCEDSRGRSVRIGHLANLTFEKGLREAVKIRELLEARLDRPVFLDIAGPTVGEDVAEFVRATTSSERVRYLGPVYGSEKAAFLGQLDFLVLVSSYVEEADPLVLHEASRYGAVPVGSMVGAIDCTALDETILVPFVEGVGWDLTSAVDGIVSSLTASTAPHLSYAAAYETELQTLIDLTESSLRS